MEQHPVPRNISGFQFKLVGDMTMRQFLYLAGGAVIAFLVFKISPFPGIIKWPIVLAAGFGGIAFAFFPVQERPLDKWLAAFIKSINSPTQYLWQKDAVLPDILLRSSNFRISNIPQNHQEAHKDAKKKVKEYVASLPKQPHQELKIREKKYVDKTLELFTQTGGFSGQLIQQQVYSPATATIKQPVPSSFDTTNSGEVQKTTPAKTADEQMDNIIKKQTEEINKKFEPPPEVKAEPPIEIK